MNTIRSPPHKNRKQSHRSTHKDVGANFIKEDFSR